jgi:hypothetical protein
MDIGRPKTVMSSLLILCFEICHFVFCRPAEILVVHPWSAHDVCDDAFGQVSPSVPDQSRVDSCAWVILCMMVLSVPVAQVLVLAYSSLTAKMEGQNRDVLEPVTSLVAQRLFSWYKRIVLVYGCHVIPHTLEVSSHYWRAIESCLISNSAGAACRSSQSWAYGDNVSVAILLAPTIHFTQSSSCRHALYN